MDNYYLSLEILGPVAGRGAAERVASALCERGIPARVYENHHPTLPGMLRDAGIDGTMWEAALRDALRDALANKNDAQ